MNGSRLFIGIMAIAAACTPEIGPGAYFCGPEQLCPDDEACNGPDNVCVLEGSAEPFACGVVTETEPNSSAATAQAVAGLTCVSVPTEIKGCVPDSSDEDWYQLDIPDNCGAVEVTARITFPIAFGMLSLELYDEAGAVVATAAPCDGRLSAEDSGSNQICLEQVVTVGAHYALRVVQSGEATCGGSCAFNRYHLNLQLGTP